MDMYVDIPTVVCGLSIASWTTTGQIPLSPNWSYERRKTMGRGGVRDLRHERR